MYVRSSASDLALHCRQQQHGCRFLSVSIWATNLLLLVQTVCCCSHSQRLAGHKSHLASRSRLCTACTQVFIKKKSLHMLAGWYNVVWAGHRLCGSKENLVDIAARIYYSVWMQLLAGSLFYTISSTKWYKAMCSTYRNENGWNHMKYSLAHEKGFP